MDFYLFVGLITWLKDNWPSTKDDQPKRWWVKRWSTTKRIDHQ